MRASLFVPYVDVAAASLVLCIESEPRPSLARLHRAFPGGHVELHVLGASHQVVLRRGGTNLVEVVACGPGGEAEPLPAAARLAVAGLQHHFVCRTSRLDDGEFRRDVEALEQRLAADPDSLVAVFPGRPTAITALRLERADADVVGWKTWHAYPQGGELVTTETEVRAG